MTTNRTDDHDPRADCYAPASESASPNPLPQAKARGQADWGFVHIDPTSGRARGADGSRLVAVPTEVFAALHDALTGATGPGADDVWRRAGRAWGDAFARSFEGCLSDSLGSPLADQTLALFEASLEEAFRSHGWGTIKVDYTRAGEGVFLAEVSQGLEPPPLMEGVLAGFFSHFAGRELDCHLEKGMDQAGERYRITASR